MQSSGVFACKDLQDLTYHFDSGYSFSNIKPGQNTTSYLVLLHTE